MSVQLRPNERRSLDPLVVDRIHSMELRARTVVEGFLTGLHRSPYQGFSVEFSEYREYVPGDELSAIDWKVFGRSDRFYVKKFEADTNLDCRILLDVSLSMSFASGSLSKQDYSASLAASLAYLMHRQRDAVGLVTFSDDIIESFPPSARPGHLQRLLAVLDQLTAGHRSDVAKPLKRLGEMLKRRGMVVVISDLLDDFESVIQGLRLLRCQGSEVIVFHVLDPAELRFPFEHAARFVDLETGNEIEAVGAEVRSRYLEQVQGLISDYSKRLRADGIDYCLVDTSIPYDVSLRTYLANRSKIH